MNPFKEKVTARYGVFPPCKISFNEREINEQIFTF